jgi:hypothetical protein
MRAANHDGALSSQTVHHLSPFPLISETSASAWMGTACWRMIWKYLFKINHLRKSKRMRQANEGK